MLKQVQQSTIKRIILFIVNRFIDGLWLTFDSNSKSNNFNTISIACKAYIITRKHS